VVSKLNFVGHPTCHALGKAFARPNTVAPAPTVDSTAPSLVLCRPTQQLALRSSRQALEHLGDALSRDAIHDTHRSQILSRPDGFGRLAPKGISDRLAGVPITRLTPAQVQPS
jgi:hypothetical protein